MNTGEKVPKHIALLQVRGNKQFKMEAIPLQTVRQFYMEDVVLSNHVDPKDKSGLKKAEDFCTEKVEELLAKAGLFYIKLI